MTRFGPLLFAVLALTGCDSCGGSRVVPFGLDQGQARETAAPDTDGTTVTTTENAPPASPIAGRTSSPLPAGTRTVQVGHETLAADEGGEFRALLAVDTDGDGDEDAFALRVTPHGGALLHLSAHPGRVAATTMHTLEVDAGGPSGEAPEPCTPAQATLRTLSEGLGVAALTLDCANGVHEARWIFSVERTPRVRERFGITPSTPATAMGPQPTGAITDDGEAPEPEPVPAPAPTAPAPRWRLAVDGADVDEDGHLDVRVRVFVEGGDDDAGVRMVWLDRTSGLSRQTAEPDETLMRMATRAANQLRRHPDRARRAAEETLDTHRALCREAGEPVFTVGDGHGLQCGRSHAAGKAATVLAAVHAQRGDVFAARRAAAEMTRRGRRVRDADRGTLVRAYDHAPRPDGLTMRDLGEVPGRGPIAFLDDDFVQVPGARVLAVSETPEGGEPPTPPAPQPGAGAVRDPSGRFEARRIGRGCGGHVIELVSLDPIMHGTPRPVLLDNAEDASAGCQGDTAIEDPQDDGGWVLLGWAPQGILAAREDEVRLVPLTAEATSAGTARTMPEGSVAPAPLRGGAVDRAGRAYVLALEEGLVVRTFGPRGSSRFLRPEGWGETEGPLRAVAIAPNLRRVAVHRGGHVYVVSW